MRIELPVTRNRSYMIHRHGAKAGIGLTDEARTEEEAIAWEALSKFGPLDPKAAYELHIVMHLDKNSRDLDSVIPLVPNAICKGIGINDNRIFRIILEKVIDGERHLEIDLQTVTPAT
jgi:Holliday junction resolvase RusA-like endonuclease